MLSFFDTQKKNRNKTITELIDEAFSNQNIYKTEPRTSHVPPDTLEKLQPRLEPFKKVKSPKLIKHKESS